MRSLYFIALGSLVACGQPADLSRAHEQIDSLRKVHRIDSLRAAAVKDSLRDGHHQYRDKDGRLLMEGEMRNGTRTGVWVSYGPKGGVMSRNEYGEGALNGPTVVFRENGLQYYTGTNRNGKPFGEWRFYDENGALARTVHYDSAGVVINDR